MTACYHGGERSVQVRAGTREQADHVGQIIQSSAGTGARVFLSTTRALVLAAADRSGRCWVTHRVGPPGLVRADEKAVLVLGGLPAEDPLRSSETGAFVGGVAIDMSRRRRLRFNGRIADWNADRLAVALDQVYGNCPQYIDPAGRYIETLPARQTWRSSAELTAEQQRIIGASRFFFVGSAHPEHGADASHRGGPAGFVRVDDRGRLSFPDYPGNGMFNTLGNIADHPGVGLLFVHESGTTLQLTGDATIHWSRPGEESPTGRRIAVDIAEIVESRPSGGDEPSRTANDD